jgi:uncharacterized protein YdeI (YjbR/CyaY-like superfamily)
MSNDTLPENAIHPKSRAAWRRWLAANHTRNDGVWLVTYKQSAGIPDISYNDGVEEALCFGWVDSRPRALDATRTMLWYAPRKPGSAWAKTNKARVERLMANGLMQEAGLAKINAAKADGSWHTLDSVDRLEIPSELQAAFGGYEGSADNFAAFPPGIKRGILEWIATARTAVTKAKRADETARLAAQNQRANQWTPKDKR